MQSKWKKMRKELRRALAELGNLDVYDSQYCSNYRPLMQSDADLIFSMAKMGAGKTAAAALRAKENPHRQMFLRNRQTLTAGYLHDKYSQIEGIAAYNNIEGGLGDEYKKLIC